MPTEAEIKGLLKCPKCEARRLKETILPDGSKRHQCISCSYLMIWKAKGKE